MAKKNKPAFLSDEPVKSESAEPKPETCLNDEGVYLMAEGKTCKVFHHPVFGPIKVKKD